VFLVFAFCFSYFLGRVSLFSKARLGPQQGIYNFISTFPTELSDVTEELSLLWLVLIFIL
jgi:hypothetical protein